MLDLLGIEGQLLMAATHDAHPDSPVDGVSGRTLAETVRHAGDLCEDTLSWMNGATPTVPRKKPPSPESGKRALVGRFTAGLAELIAEFDARPPGDPCPTWWPEDSSVTFWIRRALHATTMNRVDAQTAAGIPMTPVAPDLACDGIDEILRLWFGYRLRTLGIAASGAWTLEVRAGEHRWMIEADREWMTATRAQPDRHGRKDGVITGEASAVHLWLWGRLPARTVELTGDHDAIAQLWSLLRLATQHSEGRQPAYRTVVGV
ncbi:maleylpyruvate isomerase N-terminal domain-containing protein [Halopolyspora algeriensis]|nr:maleylpyruvate isomerase N-terminal domain-containing protein [Halopolyspora algeriensis]